MLEEIVKFFAENEGVTEKMKADASMKWGQKINRSTEIVNAKVVYA